MKKQLIMEKAVQLFAENGIEATTVQQITEKCGISKGAFYLSFKSKEELVYELVDTYMKEIIADLDQSVSDEQSDEKLLYNYYYVMFQAFQKHAGFAKIFLKEPLTEINIQLRKQMETYTHQLNALCFSVVERQYKYVAKKFYPDIVFLIQGLIPTYGQLFLMDHFSVSLEDLCRATVEKIDLIAKNMEINVIPEEFFICMNQQSFIPTKKELVDLLHRKKDETENCIIKESLELLSEHLHENNLRLAVIEGLLHNLRSEEETKWVAYLYQQFLNGGENSEESKL